MDVRRRWNQIIPLLPILPLTTLLLMKVPSQYRRKRQVAGYFQSLAYSRTGLESLSFNTPVESLSSIHLHSLLSSPLISVGYHEGGRLISLLAALGVVLVVVEIGSELFNKKIGFFAAALIWSHPLFIWSSFSFLPDSLSILITSLAILAAVNSVRHQQRYWFALSILLLIIGPMNHMWEATIVLPVVAIFACYQRWRSAAIAIGATVASAVGVYIITHIQPSGGSSLITSYSIIYTWELLFDVNWWIPPISPLDAGGSVGQMGLKPRLAISQLTLIGSLIGIIFWTLREKYKEGFQNKFKSILFIIWLLSGASIPILLPRGFLGHNYYVWALLSPVAITGAVFINDASKNLSLEFSTRTIAGYLMIISITLIILLTPFLPYLGVSFSGAPVNGVQHITPSDQALERAQDLRAEQIEDTDKIVFVGDFKIDSPQGYSDNFPTYVLIYADILPRHRSLNTTGGPSIVPSMPENCTVAVSRQNVTRC